jgi:hypothetical protein
MLVKYRLLNRTKHTGKEGIGPFRNKENRENTMRDK